MSPYRCFVLILGGFFGMTLGCSSAADDPSAEGGSAAAFGGGDESGGGNGGTGSGSSTGGVAVVLPDGGPDDDTPMDPDAECVGVDEPAKLTTVNLIFMVDKSGSMGNEASGFDPAERWIPVSQGLLAFFDDPGTTQLNASLEFFPADGNLERACSVPQYSTPRVPLTSLSEDEGGGTAPFSMAIEATSPQGGTPTLPALQGAIEYATDVALDDPAAKTVVVFVTDGEPGFAGPDGVEPGCVNNDIEHTAAVARAAFEGSPRILTYVIGIGPSLEALDAIASAGGTGMAIMVPVGQPELTKATFQQELAAIRTLHLSCDMDIPAPPPPLELDPDKVNVMYLSDGQEAVIGRSDDCHTGVGWHYTEWDDEGLPTRLELCPDSCVAVQGDVSGQLSVQFGCATERVE